MGGGNGERTMAQLRAPLAAPAHADGDRTPVPTGAPDGPVLRAATPGTAVALPTAPAPVGFRAELNGASLWDLVQLECMGRSRRVVQVTGEGGVGYLYFAGGRVVHAVTPRLVGEAAALEILNWTGGAFQVCQRGWPMAMTIETPCQSLILRAAKRRDEAAASNLLAFRGRTENVAQGQPSSSGEAGRSQETQMEEVAMTEMRRPDNNNQPPAPVPIKREDPLPDFAVMIRISQNGTIVKNKGGTEDLAGVVAYTHRLVELVGDLLGLDRFVAMECMFAEPIAGAGAPPPAAAPRCLMFTEANGDTVALRPRADSNIQPLRESLGL